MTANDPSAAVPPTTATSSEQPPHLRALPGVAAPQPGDGAVPGAPAVVAPEPAPVPQPDHAYHEASGPFASLLVPAAWVALAVIVQFADTTAAKSTFDVAFNVAEAASWFMAIAVTLGAVVSAFETGHAVRALGEPGRRHRRLRQLAVALAGGAWAALGATMFALRLEEGTLTGDPDITWRTTWPLALLIGVLYVLAGVTVMTQGYRVAHPKLRAVREAARRLTTTGEELVGSRASLVAIEEALAAWSDDVLGRLDAMHKVRLEQIEAARALLADEARLTLATALADPTRTTRVLRASHVGEIPTQDAPAPAPRPAD